MFLARGAAALAVTLLAESPPSSLPSSAPPQAPQQKLTPLTLDGYNKLIAAHKGRVVLVNFWATYCIPCRTEIPELVKFAAQLRPRGLDLVLISADEPEQEAQALKFIAAQSTPCRSTSRAPTTTTSTPPQFTPTGTARCPRNFVYDRSGKKVGAFMGEVPLKNIQDVIEKFL